MNIYRPWATIILTSVSIIRSVLFGIIIIAIGTGNSAIAQVATSITPTIGAGSLGTAVLPPVNNIYNITGGTRPGNGTNLFHSFGEFSVGVLDTARFLNTTPELATSNILGRVTGGNPSSLYGTIDTVSYGGANLFLMNPAGIVFGPNASLNVGGAVTFTTANYLRLTDAGIFHADTTASSVLTSAPVAAFGFLGSNPGAITVQGSQLSVAEGTGISLVGGNITIEAASFPDGTSQSAKLSAPGGQINVASVAGPGEVSAVDFLPTVGTTLGNINVSQGALLDVSADAAGTILIRGGQFVISDSTLSANTVNANGSPTALDIKVTEEMSITDTRGLPAMTAQTTGTGDAGHIKIESGNLSASTTYQDPSFAPFYLLYTRTEGSGNAGDVSITTGDLTVRNEAAIRSNGFALIESGTGGTGQGGDVTINARNVTLDFTSIVTGDTLAAASFPKVTGHAGNFRVNADTLSFKDVIISTEAFVSLTNVQSAGDITWNVHDINLKDSAIHAGGARRGGAITLNFDSLFTDFSFLETYTIAGPGGGITAQGRSIDLTNGSKFIATTIGNGDAGGISLTATEQVTLSGRSSANPSPFSEFSPTGLFSNSFGDFGEGSLGAAGDVTVTTPRLTLDTGGRINSITNSSGRGGNVTINANVVSMSGEFTGPFYVIEGTIVDIGDFRTSGIFTRTIGGGESCSGVCGNGGNITMTVGSLTMGTGTQIDSGTSSSGQSGAITINAGDTISLSGKLSNGLPVGIFSRSTGANPDAGSGGNIALTAGQSVTISDGASVSASSTGPGNAGNIAINAGQQFEMRNSSVKTEAAQASGGNIDIQAIDRIRLVNSSISTSVLGGAGSGGNISIDPNSVILQNSQIIAQAVQGAGGNISIVTPLFLADAGSLVDASSQFGLSGTVNIQSPTSNLAGTVSSLPSSLRQVQSLQTGRCAALADSRSSSLIVAGRDILPAEPGGWSPSPFALTMEQTDPLALAGEESSPLAISSPPVAAMTASADAPVSLRRLTPAGFLTQSFAENGLTGCRA